MAVFTAAAFADTTEQTVHSGPCSVKAIIIHKNHSQSAAAFIQLWDAANPTPGTTAPPWSFKVDTLTNTGQLVTKIIFPNGGIKFNTACTIFCSTAASGGTASTTTTLPDIIEVVYERGV